MRDFLLDAAEAVWWVGTWPIRRLAADAMQEVLKRERAKTDAPPVLKWSDNDDDQPALPLQMPQPRRLADRLGLHGLYK